MRYVKYKKDSSTVIYKVCAKQGTKVLLRGITYRKEILVDQSEVENVQEEELKKDYNILEKYKFIQQYKKRSKKYLLGTVLHIDSDKEYLEKNFNFYKQVGIYCFPLLVQEKDLNSELRKIKIGITPDIIVITGHDLLQSKDNKNIDNYKNSKFFVDAVKLMRKRYPNSAIVAGACQSHFDALIANGANFASSPKRINVHIFDPAIIAINISFTPFNEMVDFLKMKKHIENIDAAFGGVETYGKMKKLY